MKRPKLRRGTPADGEQRAPRRRRRPSRPGGPRTILPGDEPAADRPSWLPADAPVGPRQPPTTPLGRDLDAARERLRRAIPPVLDEDG